MGGLDRPEWLKYYRYFPAGHTRSTSTYSPAYLLYCALSQTWRASSCERGLRGKEHQWLKYQAKSGDLCKLLIFSCVLCRAASWTTLRTTSRPRKLVVKVHHYCEGCVCMGSCHSCVSALQTSVATHCLSGSSISANLLEAVRQHAFTA